ncbi:AprI/Inh family metalloprotease inhibitor [Pseudomonas vanderleydeniana]|nr:AprI/Inh family metalloprotease inhibitor [Pseudomonas vanderleydeniana]
MHKRNGSISGPTRQKHLGAWLLALSLTFMGEAVMASSLVLPSRESLAGQWLLSSSADPARNCVLQLSAQPPLLAGDLECATELLGARPGSWEPTPDGLWLFDQEGSGLVHLNRDAGRYWATSRQGELTLSRKSRD